MDADSKPAVPKIIAVINQAEAAAVQTLTLPVDLIKLPALTQQIGLGKLEAAHAYQADRRLRPFARREFRIARPALVLIRRRKPWLRLRFRLLG